MMRVEPKRNMARPLSKSCFGYGFVLGFIVVLLTYFTVSTQFSNYTPSAFPDAPPINPTKLEKGPPHQVSLIQDSKQETNQTEDPSEHEQEDFSNEDDVIVHEQSSRTNWDDKLEKPEDEKKHEDLEEHAEEAEKEDVSENKSEFINEDEEQSENARSEDWKAGDRTKMPQDDFNTFNFVDGRQRGGNQRPENWQEKDELQTKDTDGFDQFVGGTDDFNHPPESKPICETSFPKFDICELNGDARTIGSASTVILVSPRSPPSQWKIKPYSRKYLDGLKEVTVKSLSNPQEASPCTTRMNIPAMVIQLGGFTGNYWHDFTDVLIPLFIGARQFNSEVQFLVAHMLPFWVEKYKKIFEQLSRYEIIDFEKDFQVRCYPHVIVGYGSRKEFTIDPSETPNNYTMVDFTKMLRNAYSLGRDHPIKLRANPDKKPRLMIIDRTNSRKLLNLAGIAQAAERVGFEAIVIGKTDVSYADFAKIANSFDVMVGVHGAGLTNCLFLPTNAVLIQIVPYGKIEHIAQTDFGEPAQDMKLKYIEYSISAEESSLMAIFGKDHPMIKDPTAIHQSGWGRVAEWYLGKQDVTINIERFTPVLVQALQYLQ